MGTPPPPKGVNLPVEGEPSRHLGFAPPPGMCVGVSLSSPPLPPLSHPPQGFGSVVLVVLALTHPVSSSRPPPPLSQNTTQARFWCLRPPPPQMLLPAPPQPSASSWQHFPSHWFVPPSPPLGGVQPQGVAMGRGLKHCGVGGGCPLTPSPPPRRREDLPRQRGGGPLRPPLLQGRHHGLRHHVPPRLHLGQRRYRLGGARDTPPPWE